MSIRDLSHLPTFDAVMRLGSLSAAARALRLSQPTVRRHIEALEADLGTSLFTRAANGLTPTEMAWTVLPHARAVLEQAAGLARAASAPAQTLAGVVRITASRIVCTHILPPLLVGLQRDAPALRIELAATDAAENLAQRAADVAIRFTEPRQQALVAQRLRDVDIGLFAMPDLARAHADTGLDTLPFIADDREDQILPAMMAAGLPRPARVVLRCDDPLAQIAHVQAGLGAGICQARLALRLGLVRLLPEVAYAMPMWLVVHEDQAQVPRIRAVFDHLRVALPQVI